MTWRFWVPALALLAWPAAGCGQPVVGERPVDVEDRYVPEPPGVAVTTWARNLDTPWEIAFLPNNAGALVTQRSGVIRRIHPDGSLAEQRYADLDVRNIGEGGLMGLALDPAYPEQPYLYVMATRETRRGARNQILRLRDRGNTAGEVDRVLGNIPAGRNHNGGRIAFGPDGYLYATTGETFQRSLAQERSNLAGKILRITRGGAAAPGNPFGTRIYSWGHRNPQGLAWHPETGDLFASEHGPSGEVGVGGNFDEINVIEKGANYGWPRVVGAAGKKRYRDPIMAWPENGVPPAGMAFWHGDLYVAGLGAETLVKLEIERTKAGYRVTDVARWFAEEPWRGRYGRLRAVTVGPDGALYVSTSNRDGRGSPNPGDDRILRIEKTGD